MCVHAHCKCSALGFSFFLFPVPLSLFYIAAGPLYGIVPSLLWIIGATIVNNLIIHTISTSFLRPWLEAIVARRGQTIPRVTTKGDQTLLIALIRIAPGIPYFLQNLILGLSGVDRLRFVLVSLPVHMIWATGFVVLGRSAFEGEFGLAIGVVALIVAAMVCARFAFKRFGPLRGKQAARKQDSATQ